MSAKRQIKKIRDVITNVDLFSEPILFTFDGGKTEYKTFTGAISTLIYLGLIIGYGMLKLINMSSFVDAKVSKSTAPDYFNDEFHYNTERNPFAFGISEFQDSEPLNEDYGSITVKYEVWNAEYDKIVELKMRPCSFSDFGLDSNLSA